MADEKANKDEQKGSQAQETHAKTEVKGKPSNEVTDRDRVKDKGYVKRIEEKTEKH